MARVALPVQLIPLHGTLDDVSFTAADAANDHSMANDGDTLLIMKNDDVSPNTADVISVQDPFKRSQDLTVSAAASGLSFAGPFLKTIWNQSDGSVSVDIATDTSLFFAAVKFSKVP